LNLPRTYQILALQEHKRGVSESDVSAPHSLCWNGEIVAGGALSHLLGKCSTFEFKKYKRRHSTFYQPVPNFLFLAILICFGVKA